ncbi:proteinase inhibitor i42 chagasin [Lucifera butyrica]|uniref:Proteinase inhibitor i42 chagasin n=1 Tax=Lucifera butyrica TaxID=1351585 RepID=A0A498R876_9FIRM|nr:protease inhibitor I42 family protein [Lucifera butyrica]VBB07591.1 proteinase inhibitor i42 chagasin [Lucifera butyrica]
MKLIDVFESDYGQIIILPMDATLRVFLEEKPSTGYRWQVEGRSNCLKMVSHEFLAKSDPAIGAGGTAVFYFKPVKPGYCSLSLKLWRSWEGDKSIIKQFQIAVSVISG